MFEINTTKVKKILINSSRAHQLKINGQIVFDDEYVIDYRIAYSDTGAVDQHNGKYVNTFNTYLTVSNAKRKDDAFSQNISITVINTVGGSAVSSTYTTPLSSRNVQNGSFTFDTTGPGGSPRYYYSGATATKILINGTQVFQWSFQDNKSNDGYSYSASGSLSFYES